MAIESAGFSAFTPPPGPEPELAGQVSTTGRSDESPPEAGRLGRVELLARAGVLVAVAAGGVVAAISGSAIVVYVPYATVGAVLIVRRPGNGIGWLLAAIAWAFAVGFLPVRATVEGLKTLTAPPIVLAVAWFKSSSLPLTFALVACLAIVFPTGRLPVGRWRRPATLLLLAMSAITLSAAILPVVFVQPDGLDHAVAMPNPLRLLPLGRLDAGPGAFPAAAGLVTFALLVASIASMLVRYTRSDGIERLQLRWLVTGLAAVAIAVPVGFLLFAAFGSAIEGAAWLPAIAAFTLPPIAIGIAVLRYRLYEIDRIINRAIVYALLTAILAGGSAAVIALAQRLFSSVIGPGSDVTIVLTTLLVVSAFTPVKTRLQAIVDRWFKEAHDPEAEFEAFVAEIHGTLGQPDLDRALHRFLEVAVAAFGASGGDLRLRGAGPERAFHTGEGSNAGLLRASVTIATRRVDILLTGTDSGHDAAALESGLTSVMDELASV
jgi:hypothetical protein